MIEVARSPLSDCFATICEHGLEHRVSLTQKSLYNWICRLRFITFNYTVIIRERTTTHTMIIIDREDCEVDDQLSIIQLSSRSIGVTYVSLVFVSLLRFRVAAVHLHSSGYMGKG